MSDNNKVLMLNYMCELFENPSVYDGFRKEYSPKDVLTTVIDMTESLEEDWHVGLMTVKDACINCFGPKAVKEYRDALALSGFIDYAKRWLQIPPYQRSNLVIYFLGKLCDKEHIPLLSEAFEFWRMINPIIINSLLFELSWLQDPDIERKFNQIATHPDYLFRWEILDIGSDKPYVRKAKALLKTDSHPIIQREAQSLEDPSFISKISLIKKSFAHYCVEQNLDFNLDTYRKFVDNYLETLCEKLRET